MRISNDRQLYTVREDDHIDACCRKLEENGGLPLAVEDLEGHFIGLISNSSIRSIVTQKRAGGILARDAVVRECITMRFGESFNSLKSTFLHCRKNIKIIPLLTKELKIKAFAINSEPQLRIADHVVEKHGDSVYTIAEIGVNHNGSVDEAKYLIEAAYKSGFNAVKFQFRSDETYSEDSILEQELSVQYILRELQKNSLGSEAESDVIAYAKAKGLDVIITAFDRISLSRALANKPDAIKIASCDAMNLELLESYKNTGLPVIISTGMLTEAEILLLSEWCKDNLFNYSLLHCNSTYPTPLEDVNLSYIERLNELCDCVIGYSSHDVSYNIPVFATAYGARLIEVHITRDKDQCGTDHLASIPLADLGIFIDLVKLSSKVRGVKAPRFPSQGELGNKIALGKSLCYKSDYQKGSILTEDDFVLRSPGDGITQDKKNSVLNKELRCDVKRGFQVKKLHFTDKYTVDKDDLFKAKNLEGIRWGLPVRFRDMSNVCKLFNPPVIEFHLSSDDIDMNMDSVFRQNSIVNLNGVQNIVIHAIEQYSDGFLLDLCSQDAAIRNKSLDRMICLIEKSFQIRNLCIEEFALKLPDCLPIVVNIGGFSKTGFLDESKAGLLLENGCDSLNFLSRKYPTIKLLPQTMPPFPWHQGGQSFHNVLCQQKDLFEIYAKTGLGFTLDISHTALYCNYANIDLIEYCENIKNIVEHIHFSDASKTGEEGLPLGFGDIPLNRILDIFYRDESYIKKPSVIIEIWQGHLNNFSLFRESLVVFDRFLSQPHLSSSI